MLLHYLGKLKIQIFCKYSANLCTELRSHIPILAPVTLTLTRWPWYTNLT